MSDGTTRLIQLSDIHAAEDGPLYGAVDGIARLERAGTAITELGLDVDAVLVTGDLAQTGHLGAYPALGTAFDRLSRIVGAPVLLVPGNHDHPTGFLGLPQAHGVADRVVELERLRVVLLDSSTGALGTERMRWLAERIASPYRDGTVIALHHPPIASPLAALAGASLADAEALTEALHGSDVRLIVAGHFHHPQHGSIAGVPVWVGPALAYQQDMTAGADLVRGIDLPLFSLISIDAVGHSTVTVPLAAHPPLFTSPARQPTAVITLP